MKFSVVTPSFNSVSFVETCLRSVLDQGYPNLEYIVVDGGSTDGTVEVIRRYADRLAWWVSEPDKGHYDAVNKGFARATGDIMCFINSDDMLAPGSLATVAAIFDQFPDISWISGMSSVWNEKGECVSEGGRLPVFGRKYLAAGEHDSRLLRVVQQETCFWRRGLWEAAGGRIDTHWDLAGDFELWTRMARHAELVGVGCVLAGYHRHPGQRGALQKDEYFRQVDMIGARLGCRAWLRSHWVRRLFSIRGGWWLYRFLFPAYGPVLVRILPEMAWKQTRLRVIG